MKRIRLCSLVLAVLFCLTVLPLSASASASVSVSASASVSVSASASVSSSVSASAGEVSDKRAGAYAASASFLRDLGLFRGTSDGDFDLWRPADRVEGVVMIVRLSGAENEALRSHCPHPFTDVPAWADDYIGYAWELGIVNGVSPDRFGTGPVTSAMYLTWLLRVLGYSDALGDFRWDDPFSLAEEVGLLTEYTATVCDLTSFLRADMAYLSRSALTALTKEDGWPLAAVLAEKHVFTSRKYIDATVRYRGDLFISPEEGSSPNGARTPGRVIPTDGGQSVEVLSPTEQQQEIPARSVPANALLSPYWADIAGAADQLVYFVNTETGKIHVPSCKYCDRAKYDWPLAFTVSPDALIASDPLVYSYCQVCCKGR